MFFREFVSLGKLRILKMGQIAMDSRFQKSCLDLTPYFKGLRCLHLGAIRLSFWLS